MIETKKRSIFIAIALGIILILTRDILWLQISILVVGLLLMLFVHNFDNKELNESINTLKDSIEKDAKDQIDETSAKLEQIIAAIPNGLVYINHKGDFEVFNRKFINIIGEDILDVYDYKVEENFRQILLDAFLNEKQFVRQINLEGVDYQALAVPMFKDGRNDGSMIIMQDVTQLLDGERLQKRFITEASHELKTPISSIKNMIERINRDEVDSEETSKEYLAQIQIESARLHHIVEDLLLQSKHLSDKVHIDKTLFNLKQFFDGLIYEKRRELHEANIKVVLNCPSDVMIEADHFRLSQVIINLFNNSINYAKDEEIRIDCDISRRRWVIKFCDTGAGIKPSVLPHIFERFYHGNEEIQRYNGISGLGLAVSKSIIEAHDGDITVKSEVGKGTCFTISLPPTIS